jgi:anthranilate synthase component 1
MMVIEPSLQDFLKQTRRARVVPVWTQLVADLDTPVSAFRKFDDGHAGFLLESVEGEEKLARFSFLGTRPRWIFESRGAQITLTERAPGGRATRRTITTDTDPLTELQRRMAPLQAAPVPGLPRLFGGLVGYLGYATARHIERLPAHGRDPLAVPDIVMMLADTMVIFDHATRRVWLVANALLDDGAPRALYRRCVAQLTSMAARLAQPMGGAPISPAAGRNGAPTPVRSNVTPAQFSGMVRRAKDHIRAGDIIQVVLSQRFERPCQADPLDVYRALRALNPSPYMFFLRTEQLALAGSSPEMLVRCEDGRIETRPIAGTRRRGATPQEDARLIQQLLASPKERAEHLMLVDLGRNDLGRVAATASVTTPELMVIEKYSHVMHLVSSVHAKLAAGKNAFDVLRATFPAGTVAGAPKVRAMQIIADLEPDERGPYAGAVGYLSFTGNLDTCITIRTILMRDGVASVQAGAGIVADSNPAREYQESVSKARACLAAIDVAEQARPRRVARRRAEGRR